MVDKTITPTDKANRKCKNCEVTWYGTSKCWSCGQHSDFYSGMIFNYSEYFANFYNHLYEDEEEDIEIR